MKFKDIVFCWDFILAIIIFFLLYMILPNKINIQFTKDIYQTAISVLSIIFSLYFASLAIIMTTNQDGFISFLEEDGIYSGIIDTFKFTLIINFAALIISIILYTFTSYQFNLSIKYQPKLIFLIFIFLFIYALFSVFNASIDSIIFSKKRIEYLKIKSNNKK